MLDGTQVNGVVGLRQAVLRAPDAFVGTVTEKLLTYALGRGLDAYDMPAVRQIVRDAARQDYKVSIARPGHRQQHAVSDADEADAAIAERAIGVERLDGVA